MCLAWGLPPNWVEALPGGVQEEMRTFWRWKNEREHMLQKLAEAQAKEQGRVTS